MTPDDADRLIDDVAQEVVDGKRVDWEALRPVNAATARLIGHLKLVALVAQTHREGDQSSSPGDPASPAEGQRPGTWGHLQITESIGRGAFGEVYRAWDTRLEREVALKLIPVPGADEGASSMIREGRLLARVRHPNVVTIHGADQLAGYVGLSMELVQGRTLHQLLEDTGPLQPSEVARIGAALAHAVAAVHTAGLLHRDIKAQNVVRSGDDRIVLMDFGTGRDLDDPRSDLTGTPLYLAPELFRGQPATAQTDIYSLGVLLFYLLTRTFPVQGQSVRDVRHAHDQRTRVTVRAVRPDVPAALARVIERAIDPDPQIRQQTAAAMAVELERAAAPPRRWQPWLAVAAATVVAIVAASYAWRPSARPVIGILPFEYRAPTAGAQDLEGIPAGFIIELNRRLAQVDGLDVRSTTSSLAYKGPHDAQAFGRHLGVTYVLEGSVFADAHSIRRINASLIRIADDETVWAESFVPDNDDLFAVQERIARAIVDQLRLRFALGERRHQTNPALQGLVYRAQALRTRRDIESTTIATAIFDEIIKADPAYVPAIAGLAHTLLTINGDRDAEPLLDPRAESLATRAYADDPNWAEANTAMGLLCAQKREWGCARTYFETAMRLDPSLTATHSHFILSTLLPLGELVEALRIIERARTEDPGSVDVRRTLAHLQVENGLYDQAIETSRAIMAEDADLRFVEQWMGRAFYLSGRTQEALAVFKRPGQWGYRGYVYAVEGRRSDAEALLKQYPQEDARHVLVYAGLGDRDRAFAALEQAALRDPWRTVTWMQRPEMRILHDDPRFEELRMRLLEPRPLPVGRAGNLTSPRSSPPAQSAAPRR